MVVGYVRCRENKLRKRRYTAVFHDVRGIERSAGTFADKAAAARAWKAAEASVADGRYLDLDQGRTSFEEYARGTWLPQYEGEESTVQNYDYYLEKYLIPEFGATRMIEVTPGRVRAFYALMRDAHMGRPTIEKCKTVLCSLFNTAVNDRVVGLHPCRGVNTAPVVQAKLRILTPPEYAALSAHLRDDYARLMVDVLLETGCRWGEFAELRVGDLDALACTITVARTVVEVKSKYTATGERGFVVKAYPKNTYWRDVAISRELADRLTAQFAGRDRNALMFPAVGRHTGRRSRPGAESSLPEAFKVNGRSFTHGTLYAYTKGSCRCEACREAVAAYRAARRGQGKDRPPVSEVPEAVGEARHMRRDWFRHRVFRPAVEAAGLEWRVRVHDLRHASASWALAGGATVQQVREHLGHVSLRAVERYLHSLPGADNGAAGAIARVKETGTLYPVITPSYTPAPPLAVATAAAQISTRVPAAVLDEIQGAAAADTASPAQEAEPRKTDVEYPAPEAGSGRGEEICPDRPTAAVELTRSVPHRGPVTGSRQHPRKKKRENATHPAAVNGQDRRIGDRHAADTRTTPELPDSAPRHGLHAEAAERGPNQAGAGPKEPVTRADAREAAAHDRAMDGSRALRREPTYQASKLPAMDRRQEDPLTSDGQTIKKPIPSTTGDRL